MKKLFAVLLFVLVASCDEARPKKTISFYSNDGVLLRVYHDADPIMIDDGMIKFKDKDGRRVTMHGNWIME